MSEPLEEWRPLPGYEGLYEISNRGRARSVEHVTVDTLGRSRTYPGIMLRAAPAARDGYPIISLRKDGNRITARIHELVLLTFVGPRPPGMQHIRHLNGIPSDNRLENLTYGTARENMLDIIAHGKNPRSNQTHCKRNHPLTDDNVYKRGTRRQCRACTIDRAKNQSIRPCVVCGVGMLTTIPCPRHKACRELATAC